MEMPGVSQMSESHAEQEQEFESKVVIELMRHGKREKHPDQAQDGGPRLPLTSAGRAQADARGEALHPQSEVALGWGSPRDRARETAYRVMLASEEIGSEDTLEEIEAKIAEELRYGKKMIADERLDFHDNGPIAAAGVAAYHAKQYMPWVIERSDVDALAEHDTGSSTYTRMAGNVAELVLREASAGKAFNRIASQTDKYEATGNRLESYMGTHQGIAESFVAKILEEVQGDAAKKEFLDSVGSGFNETEGAHIEIINKGQNDQVIRMTYKLKDDSGEREESVEFGVDVLRKIISDRETFDAQIAAAV